MSQIERALLIINRTAGVGHGEAAAERLSLMFKEGFSGGTEVRVELVSDHATARACAGQFVSASEALAAIVVGGGGGTLRAVIEVIWEAYREHLNRFHSLPAAVSEEAASL